MLDRTDDISIAAEDWLAQFERALARPDGAEAILSSQRATPARYLTPT
jgi:hypothetical protein